MKFLVVLLLLVSLAASEDHNVKKRSPDRDVYYFYPLTGRAGGAGTHFTQARTRVASSVFPYRPGYFYDFDDLYDDRRKRQTKPSDSATHRQKREASEDHNVEKRSPDRDVYFFYPLTGGAGGAGTHFTQARTRVASSVVPYRPGYFYDFDDLYDDRRKRQTKPSDSATHRQKRETSEDHNVEKRSPDRDVYYFYPLTGRAGGAGTHFTQARTRVASSVFPYRPGYFYDFDDLYDDRRKRQTKPSDSATHR